MQPARRSDPFRPLARSSERARPIDRRFGLDTVDLVVFPDPYAAVVKGLQPGADLAVGAAAGLVQGLPLGQPIGSPPLGASRHR
jgi:hypothetical protein